MSVRRSAGTLARKDLHFTLSTTLWLAGRGSLENVRNIPWYAWSAGRLGVVIVGALVTRRRGSVFRSRHRGRGCGGAADNRTRVFAPRA